MAVENENIEIIQLLLAYENLDVNIMSVFYEYYFIKFFIYLLMQFLVGICSFSFHLTVLIQFHFPLFKLHLKSILYI